MPTNPFQQTQPYQVQIGDSIQSLAQMLGLPADWFKLINPLSGSSLIPGSTIKVPIVDFNASSVLPHVSAVPLAGTTVNAPYGTNTSRRSQGDAPTAPYGWNTSARSQGDATMPSFGTAGSTAQNTFGSPMVATQTPASGYKTYYTAAEVAANGGTNASMIAAGYVQDAFGNWVFNGGVATDTTNASGQTQAKDNGNGTWTNRRGVKQSWQPATSAPSNWTNNGQPLAAGAGTGWIDGNGIWWYVDANGNTVRNSYQPGGGSESKHKRGQKKTPNVTHGSVSTQLMNWRISTG